MKWVFIGGMSISYDILETACELGHIPELVIGYPPSLSKRSNYKSFEELAEKFKFALELDSNVNSEHRITQIKALKPDWIFVFGWSQLVNAELIDSASSGALGLHVTLLPEGRGRAPIPWTLIKCLDHGGVTFFHLTTNAYDGDICAQAPFAVSLHDDAASLTARCSEIAVQIWRSLLPDLAAGRIPRHPQGELNASIWPKRTPSDGIIDWSKSSTEIYNWIRGLTDPFPGAFSFLNGQRYNFLNASMLEISQSFPAGTIIGPVVGHGEGPAHQGGLAVAIRDGIIIVKKLQKPGDSPMSGAELSGFAKSHQGKRFQDEVEIAD